MIGMIGMIALAVWAPSRAGSRSCPGRCEARSRCSRTHRSSVRSARSSGATTGGGRCTDSPESSWPLRSFTDCSTARRFRSPRSCAGPTSSSAGPVSRSTCTEHRGPDLDRRRRRRRPLPSAGCEPWRSIRLRWRSTCTTPSPGPGTLRRRAQHHRRRTRQHPRAPRGLRRRRSPDRETRHVRRERCGVRAVRPPLRTGGDAARPPGRNARTRCPVDEHPP